MVGVAHPCVLSHIFLPALSPTGSLALHLPSALCIFPNLPTPFLNPLHCARGSIKDVSPISQSSVPLGDTMT
eukprot:c6033_g1_i1 orf=372-587(+)